MASTGNTGGGGSGTGGGGGHLREKLFAALTGRTGVDVSGAGDDLRGMLRAIGGTSSRTRSGIDLTQAATRLGVSRRTVERWVKTAETGTGQRPSAQRLGDLRRRSRQVASTKAGRRQAAQSAGAAKKLARGARVSITGVQGPQDPKYRRKRTTMMDLDPDDAQAMLDAWQNGGEQGFLGWATQYWGDNYVPDWGFGGVDTIDIQSPYGGGWQ